MTMFQTIGEASDRVMAKLIAGLEIEFGRDAGAALAERFLAAEESDFCWDARANERWLGTYIDADGDDLELERIAIFGRLDGQWFAATCIVDGEGMPHGMTAHRHFESRREAEQAFANAR